MKPPDTSPLDSISFAHLRSTHPRKEKVRGIVLHWTGGAGDPDQVYRTLTKRRGPHSPDGLSVHYVVGVDGEVRQFAPHSFTCLHAGVVNEWTIGIEIISPGLPFGAAWKRERSAGVVREIYRDRIRGAKELNVLDFTAAQTREVTLLVESICAMERIPTRVPTEADGSLMRRPMGETELASFGGVFGHYHCHISKLDPGTQLLDRLRERWA